MYEYAGSDGELYDWHEEAVRKYNKDDKGITTLSPILGGMLHAVNIED